MMSELASFAAEAGAHPYIQNALAGNVEAAGGINYHGNLVSTDRRFNAVSAAMNLLAQNPYAALVCQAIEHSFQPGTLDHTLASLLNETQTRDTQAAPHFMIDEPLKGVPGHCAYADGQLVQSVAVSDPNRRTRLYINEDGEPVFVKQLDGAHSDDPHIALSFLPVGYNGVTIPAGSILAVHDRQGQNQPGRGEIQVAYADSSRIAGFHPLRLSSVALSREDKRHAIGPYLPNGQPIPQAERKATVERLRRYLPGGEQLLEYAEGSQSLAWRRPESPSHLLLRHSHVLRPAA